MLKKLLHTAFLIYFLFTIYVFKSYEDVNDKLIKTIDMLLRTCTMSKIDNWEKQRYR